jgi:lipid-binding SYLF domain-containing protein
MKKIRCYRWINTITAVLIGSLIIGLTSPANANDQQALVDRARITFEGFMGDPNMAWLRDNLHAAKGLLIVPSLLKAGFIFGGSGGSGVLIVPDPNNGNWSEPAFYTVGSVTFGLQIGGEAAEVIMFLRTQRAVDRMLTSRFKIGGDTSIAVGPVGAGASANVVADILSFSRSRGAFAGLSLQGAVISPRNEWNTRYFGKEVRPVDILVTRSVSNPGSTALREAVAKAAKK